MRSTSMTEICLPLYSDFFFCRPSRRTVIDTGASQVNKLVRYNCRQAVNLDIAMFLPSVLSLILQFSLGDDFKKLAPLASAGSDIIFVTVVACVLYSIGSSALGVQPENLPLISKFNRERMRGRDGDDGKEK